MLENKIKRLQGDINRLENQRARAVKLESDSLKRINQATSTMNRTKSMATLKNKEREIQRENNKIQKAKKEQSTILSRITKKNAELNKATDDLNKYRQKEQIKLIQAQEKNLHKYKASQAHLTNEISRQSGNVKNIETPKEYDVFISHSSDDKDEFVNGLVQKLKKAGVKVWYDEDNIGWGQSIRQEIDKGLSYSTYGIVVLSPSFIKKHWTNYELDGILSKESSTGRQVILPIWHKISADEATNYSPSLAGKLALNTAINTTDEIVNNVKKLLE